MLLKTYKGMQIKVIAEGEKSLSDLKAILRLINNYDHNYSYIDDLKQYRQAISSNNAIKAALVTLGVNHYVYFDHVVCCKIIKNK